MMDEFLASEQTAQAVPLNANASVPDESPRSKANPGRHGQGQAQGAKHASVKERLVPKPSKPECNVYYENIDGEETELIRFAPVKLLARIEEKIRSSPQPDYQVKDILRLSIVMGARRAARLLAFLLGDQTQTQPQNSYQTQGLRRSIQVAEVKNGWLKEGLDKSLEYVDVKLILLVHGVPVEVQIIDPLLITYKRWEHLMYDAERVLETLLKNEYASIKTQLKSNHKVNIRMTTFKDTLMAE